MDGLLDVEELLESLSQKHGDQNYFDKSLIIGATDIHGSQQFTLMY